MVRCWRCQPQGASGQKQRRTYSLWPVHDLFGGDVRAEWASNAVDRLADVWQGWAKYDKQMDTAPRWGAVEDHIGVERVPGMSHRVCQRTTYDEEWFEFEFPMTAEDWHWVIDLMSTSISVVVTREISISMLKDHA